MNIRTLSLVFGAALTVAAGGLAGTACSSSSNNPGGGGNDASTNHDTGTSSGGNNDSGSGGGDDSGNMMGDDGGTGGGMDCGKVATLHASEAGTIFCGYDDAGNTFSCSGQMGECCLGGKNGSTYEPQECGMWGGACPNSGAGDAASAQAIPIQCNQNSDCTANGKSGDVCCLVGAGQNTPAGCTAPGTIKYSGGSVIQCETPTSGACAAGEVQICSQDTDCPSGMHCNPGHWKIFQLGFCQ